MMGGGRDRMMGRGIGLGGLGTGLLRQVSYAVLQHADFDASAADALCSRAVGRLHRSVAHSDRVDAEERNVMIDDQVTDYALRHILRVGDCSLSFAGGEALHLNDHSALSLHLIGDLIERFLGFRAQNLLSWAEAD